MLEHKIPEPTVQTLNPKPYMYYSLNSVKVGCTGDYIRDYYRRCEGDTRSLDPKP